VQNSSQIITTNKRVSDYQQKNAEIRELLGLEPASLVIKKDEDGLPMLTCTDKMLIA